MEREEELAAWWKGVHEKSKQGLYFLMIGCVRPMQVGKTLELRWRSSAKSGLLDARVVSEEPDSRGTGVDTSGWGSVRASRCGETGTSNCVTVVHPDGKVEDVFPHVSIEEVEGWWRGLRLDSKDVLRMLVTWLEELKGKDVVRIKKLAAVELQFSRSRRRGPARADWGSGLSWPGWGGTPRL